MNEVGAGVSGSIARSASTIGVAGSGDKRRSWRILFDQFASYNKTLSTQQRASLDASSSFITSAKYVAYTFFSRASS